MDITSLQALIAQFNNNFKIQPTKQDTASNSSTKTPATSTASTPATGTTTTAAGDTVTLSPEALAYQKSHVLPSGKFLKPNVVDEFLSALDGSDDDSDQSNDSGATSLLDILNSKSNDGTSSLDTTTPFDPNKPFDTLKGFLG